MLFILAFTNVPCVDSINSECGSSFLDPYDEDRFFLEAEAGEQIQLTYEASLYPVECALYILQSYDWSVNPSLIDLNILTRTYHRIGISDKIGFTATESPGFLLVVLNTANFSQSFDYEWVRTVQSQEMIALTTTTILLIWVLICGFCLLLFRRRHRQLIRIKHAHPDPSLDTIEHV